MLGALFAKNRLRQKILLNYILYYTSAMVLFVCLFVCPMNPGAAAGGRRRVVERTQVETDNFDRRQP